MVEIRDDILCAIDREAFARELGIRPDVWQRDLLRSSSDRTLLNCCRQSGKSTMAAIIALHRALYHPGSLTLILAPAERQAKETFGKVLTLYRKLGHDVPTDSYRKLGMELSSSSRIEALPGSEKTIWGFSSVDLLILDEASRIDDALFYATKPMLGISGGALMMLSTPAGQRGIFFEEWTDGAGWERYEVRVEDVPRIPETFIEEERRALPRRVFDQEYRCQFVEIEDAVFSLEDIDSAITDEVQPLFGEAS